LSKNQRIALSAQQNGPLFIPQFEVLASWSDSSVRWALIEWPTDVVAGGNNTFFVHTLAHDDTRPTALQNHFQIEQKSDCIALRCENTLFSFGKDGAFPCRIQSGSDEGLRMFSLSTTLTTPAGHTCQLKASRHTIETRGSQRLVICSEGTIQHPDIAHPLEVIARTHIFGAGPRMQIDLVLRNSAAALHPGNFWDLGDAGSVLFADFSVVLTADTGVESVFISESMDCPLRAVEREVCVVQKSSGAEKAGASQCQSPPHHAGSEAAGWLSCDGEQLPLHRAQPALFLNTGSVGCSLAVKQFWQNCPKVLHYADAHCRMGLFPHEAQTLFELQGGEQKSHCLCLSFFSPAQRSREFAAWVESPLLVTLPPAWYHASQAAPYMPLDASGLDSRYSALVDGVIRGPRSFYVKREEVDEFGWRNFGDVFADHETAYSKDPLPIASHYNNQFDVIHGLLYQFWRTGDEHFYSLFCDMAHHVRDIDVYHTTKDRLEYNGGLFWHTNHYVDAQTASHRCYSRRHYQLHPEPAYNGGGPCLHHCYCTGLLHHYLLTGDRFSLEALTELYAFVYNNVMGPAQLLPRVVRGMKRGVHKLLRELKGIEEPYDLDGPGRGAANALSTLVDAWSFTGDNRFCKAAERVLVQCISPRDNQHAMQLDNAELRWMYTLFLMAVGKYLQAKDDAQEHDARYHYAQSSLLHYVRWMVVNEKPYLSAPHKLQYPTESWAVQELRKALCFFIGSHYAAGEEQKNMVERGRYFYNRCFEDLKSFAGKEEYTRPQAILMRDGLIAQYYAMKDCAV
jgi:hypothetical protein